MGPISISVISKEDSPEALRISEGLKDYNVSKVGDSGRKPLIVCAQSASGELLGGLIGFTHWDWLAIQRLWISELQRGKGLGKLLVFAAENEAAKRGCRRAQVDTFSFQAPGFYEKLGYVEFGRVEDYPVPGQTRHYFQKRDLGA